MGRTLLSERMDRGCVLHVSLSLFGSFRFVVFAFAARTPHRLTMKYLIIIVLWAVIAIAQEALPTVTSKCGDGRVDIVVSELSSKVQNLFWVNGTKIVFAHTSDRKIFRSTDDGKTWTNIMYKLNNAGAGVTNVVESLHNQTVYFYSPNKFWATRDRGETFTYASTPTFEKVRVHPTRFDWLLASTWESTLTSRYRSLYLSTDFGVTWTQKRKYVHDWAWGLPSTYSKESHSIWSIEYKDNLKWGYQPESPNPDQLQTIRTLDFFRGTWGYNVPENGWQLLTLPQTVYLATLKNGKLSLYISRDDGENWQQTRYPTQLEENNYWIMSELDEGVVFMTVVHGQDQTYGTLYVSDDDGYKYTTSMWKNRVTADGPDFARFKGLEGIFMANQLGHSADEIDTQITYDKGGSWENLPAPSPARQGDRLNLFGLRKSSAANFNRAGPVHTRESAVGIVLGTGNVGEYLDTSAGAARTYLSRDAGWTWKKISDTSLFGEFGDYGSVIVLADSFSPTTSVKYTLNQGKTELLDCPVVDRAITVDNVQVEPTFTSETFVVYGTRDGKGVVVFLDFARVHDGRICGDDDFEPFTPRDNDATVTLSEQCLNGETLMIQRKKADSDCFVPEAGVPPPKRTPCPCRHEDYQCEECFLRSFQGVCEPVKDCKIEENPCINGARNVTKGYILVGHTKCDYDHPKSLKLLPKEVPCSGSVSGARKFVFVSMVVLIVLVSMAVVVLVAVIVLRNKPEWREKLPAWLTREDADIIRDYSRQLDLEDNNETTTAFDESLLDTTNPDNDE
ncbi:hypothetical protein PROFUN_06135 [Planoprotostelium fungivorum]|uniref:VPS10 domain-containing protein n=1 Tax=Planoprotostelium fungivorum TaxID=1890364 RepID=A0A2P6NPI4_9EUKA|nr:hypothetical protein PROFUN_06135 [Planoprotostelium fungivorum]